MNIIHTDVYYGFMHLQLAGHVQICIRPNKLLEEYIYYLMNTFIHRNAVYS